MPIYRYEAVDQNGRTCNGAMPAQDESVLEQKLKQAGLWVTDIAVHKPKYGIGSRPESGLRRYALRGKQGRRELIDLCTFMAYQTRVGITLVKALEVACEDCKNPGFKKVLLDLQRQIESGLRFHEALALYPGVFTNHFVSVVKAGETASKLPEAFTDLRNYLEWMDRVMADVRQATLYPAIVLTVVFAFVVFLFVFIIPKFAALLGSLHVAQPLVTQLVFGAGDFATATWWIWVPLLLLLALLVPLGSRLPPRVKLKLDQFKLRLPIFGDLNLMLALSRFTHNLALLYRSGLPIVQALEMCQQGLIGNLVVEKAVTGMQEDIETGSTISEAMRRHPVFSAFLLRMVAVGETSGNLDQALQNVSDYYTEIIPRRIKAVFSVFEPALMLFMIFLVGTVALAIYLPILSIMSSIQH